MDHTFKVASNIGVNNPDGKWATQFSSLMCILSEAGKVLSWKLTKSEAFDHIEDMLQALKSRHSANGTKLKGACIDNCCHWRTKLQTVFGEDFIVVLDLFHAISRITRKMPKHHNLRSHCVKNLRLVFRSPSDVGEERREETPCSEVMKEQMNAFLDKWSGVENEKGEAVLPQKAIKECKKLIKHIDKDCLSGIPPHLSTSKNERLHRNLKAQITNCKLGVAVALAALTVAFYRHNAKTLHGVVPPVLSIKNKTLSSGSASKQVKANESFGLGPSMASMDSVTLPNSTSWCESPLDNDAIAALLQVTTVDPTLEVTVYHTLSMKFYEDEMNVMFNDLLTFEPRFIPYLPTVLTVMFNTNLAPAYNRLPSESSESVITRYNLSYLDVPGSTGSNASFQFALAQQIYNYLTTSPGNFATHLTETLKLERDLDLSDIQTKVCSLAVDCPENPEHLIQPFSNAVGSVFNIITKSKNFVMIPVFPNKRNPDSPGFNFFLKEAGAFCPLIWSKKRSTAMSPVIEEDQSYTSCHCDRSRKQGIPKCVTKSGQKYPSRCSCLAKSMPCTSECECQGCENPFGIKPLQLGRRVLKRQRVHHHAQTVLESVKKGIDLILESNEIPTLGCWTRMEHFLFEAIVANMKMEKTCNIDKESIKIRFNQACDVLQSTVTSRLSISSKSLTQVQSKIRVHERVLSAFTELLRQEISELFNSSQC